MRPGMLLVASGVGVALTGPACGSPCRAISAEYRSLQRREATATTAHARVQVPFALANRVSAEVLQSPPELPVTLRRLGPLRPFVGDVHAVPRRVEIGPAGPGRVTLDLRIELRDRAGELITVAGRAELAPRLVRRDGRPELVIGLGAEQVVRLEPELGPRAAGALGGLLAARLPGPVRGRIPQAVIDQVAGELAGELVEHGYGLLRGPLRRRLGELTTIRVRLPEVPVARVEVASTATTLELTLFTSLPVRTGLGPARPPPADAVAVQISGSTVAELASWAVDHGVLPRRYTRKLKPDPGGAFVPRMDWRAGHERPMVVHLFQVDRGCSHFQVGARPLLAVRDGQLVASIRDRRLERAQGPPLIRLAAWLRRQVESSVERSRRAAATTRVTVGGRPLDTRLTHAEVAGDEVRFAFQVSAPSRSLVSVRSRAKP